MAFVNEEIQEKDKEYFNSFNLKSPFTRKSVKPFMWTIDRKRNVFLTALAGQGFYGSEIPMFYALVWNNSVVIIEAFSRGEGSNSTGAEIWWKITSIKAPECLINDGNEMMDLIKEAFDSHGSDYMRDHVKKVNFDFIASPYFVKEH